MSEEKEMFACPYDGCDKEFDSEKGLKIHISMAHKDEEEPDKDTEDKQENATDEIKVFCLVNHECEINKKRMVLKEKTTKMITPYEYRILGKDERGLVMKVDE